MDVYTAVVCPFYTTHVNKAPKNRDELVHPQVIGKSQQVADLLAIQHVGKVYAPHNKVGANKLNSGGLPGSMTTVTWLAQL
jgi:hypothetical protein